MTCHNHESRVFRLIKAIPFKNDIDETIFNETIEMESDNIETLKSKGNEIARALGNKEIIWCSRYPVMGDDHIQSVKVFQLDLSNGTILEIRL